MLFSSPGLKEPRRESLAQLCGRHWWVERAAVKGVSLQWGDAATLLPPPDANISNTNAPTGWLQLEQRGQGSHRGEQTSLTQSSLERKSGSGGVNDRCPAHILYPLFCTLSHMWISSHYSRQKTHISCYSAILLHACSIPFVQSFIDRHWYYHEL